MQKRVLIFGASGQTGIETVKAALGKEYQVTAFVRDARKLPINDHNLTTIEGDIFDKASIDKAFAEIPDVVISVLGIFHKTDQTPLADGTRNLIEVMQAHNCKRLINLSSLGVGDSKGQGNFTVHMVLKFILPSVIKDKQAQEDLIIASDLDWTIIRPPQLLEKPTDKDVIVWQQNVPKRKIKWKIGRNQVANCLIELIGDNVLVKKAIQISN